MTKEKLILIDFSQIILSNIFVSISNKENLHHSAILEKVLYSLAYNAKKFSPNFDNVIICCDCKGSDYWRKNYFKNYKNSNKSPNVNSINWEEIYSIIELVKNALRIKNYEYRYKILEVPTAEADDIISVITSSERTSRDIVIISADKDFKQLHSDWSPIIQYDPINNKYITCDFPKLFLEEQIIRGDRSDCISNILSNENCLTNGIRQKSITQKFLDQFINNKETYLNNNHSVSERYQQNAKLIDLRNIPFTIASDIIINYLKLK